MYTTSLANVDISTLPAVTYATTVPSLPEGLTKEVYERALDFARLASKTYDWDDFKAAQIGMSLFSGIDDIMEQDFSTPNYIKCGGGGNYIDRFGGNDYGLDCTLVENKYTRDLVLAFRGSEPLSIVDWIEDVKQAFGHSKQYETAVELAKSLQKKAEERNVRLFFTGHSLGGGLATAAALATGCETIVFDSAGVSDGTIKDP